MPLMPGSLRDLDLLDSGSRAVVRLMFVGVGLAAALIFLREVARSADAQSPLVQAFSAANVGSSVILLGLLLAITFGIRGGRGIVDHRIAFRLFFVAIYAAFTIFVITQPVPPLH
jgi:hypothetical protein